MPPSQYKDIATLMDSPHPIALIGNTNIHIMNLKIQAQVIRAELNGSTQREHVSVLST